MRQTTIFDPPRSRSTDPITSHKAAAKLRVSASHALVLAGLQDGPLTAEQLVAKLTGYISPSRVRGAISELCDAGSVVVCGIGETMLGNECQIYGRAKG
jgi:hypothetical protein